MGAQFIVVEGLDGAGTTTQAELLSKALAEQGRKVLSTREPSVAQVGQFLRSILAQEETKLSREELALLFTADRLAHLREEIQPALAARQTVVCDRYYHSTLAYQLKTDDKNLEWLCHLNQPALKPDITFFLDVKVETSLARLQQSGRTLELFETKSQLKRIKRNYQTVISHLQKQGELIVVLDGEADPQKILKAELKLLSSLA